MIPHNFNRDVPVCRSAIVQAMRLHFNLSNKRIMELTGMKSQNISRACLCPDEAGIMPWWKRKHQHEAIAEAERIILNPRIL